MPSFGDMTLGAAAIAAITYVAAQALGRKSQAFGLTIEQALGVIKSNTEINARLVTNIEQQTRSINELVSAVNRLVGRIEGGD